MKNSSYLTVVAGLLFLCFLQGCGESEPALTTEVYVFIDVTDSIHLGNKAQYHKSLDEILDKMGVDTASAQPAGGEVKFFLLDDVSNSISKKAYLSTASSGLLGENPFDRMDEIKQFRKELKTGINELIGQVNWKTKESKIYQNVCRELKHLATKKADQKVVIIFSDMRENSSLFSFYGHKGARIEQMTKNIEETHDNLLAKDCELPNLEGIDIYIVSPRNQEIDEQINKAERFWTKLFEYKNAKVNFDSELDF